MKILLIDTTTSHCYVALITENGYTDGSVYNCNTKHSELLCQCVENLMAQTNTTFCELDAFAVGIGVGSFTGIRIGVATVLGYHRATAKPIVSVPSLLMLSQHSGNGHVVYDAGNGYYYANYNGLELASEPKLIDYEDNAAQGSYHYDKATNYIDSLVATARKLYNNNCFSNQAVPLYIRRSQAEINADKG